jgi:hypothetical protein
VTNSLVLLHIVHEVPERVRRQLSQPCLYSSLVQLQEENKEQHHAQAASHNAKEFTDRPKSMD